MQTLASSLLLTLGKILEKSLSSLQRSLIKLFMKLFFFVLKKCPKLSLMIYLSKLNTFQHLVLIRESYSVIQDSTKSIFRDLFASKKPLELGRQKVDQKEDRRDQKVVSVLHVSGQLSLRYQNHQGQKNGEGNSSQYPYWTDKLLILWLLSG